ncbi:hypothetical protein ACH4OW_38965 [Streptomyces sp. NPDC017056]|uniref:hypothetical protein n=1 Tax=Streptomyces sp. NPDC017056 TaxID=3364973 RepID=UPI0037AC77B9
MAQAILPVAVSGLMLATTSQAASAAEQGHGAFQVRVVHVSQSALEMKFTLPEGDRLAVNAKGELAVNDATGKELDKVSTTFDGGSQSFSGKWSVNGDKATLHLTSIDGSKIPSAANRGFGDWLSCVGGKVTTGGATGAISGCIADAATGCAPGALAGGVAGGVGGAVAGVISC